MGTANYVKSDETISTYLLQAYLTLFIPGIEVELLPFFYAEL